MRMCKLKLLISHSKAGIPRMHSRSQLKMTLHVIWEASCAKAIIDHITSICVPQKSSGLFLQNSWHKWSVISYRGGQAHGAYTHHTPQAMTSQQRPPHPRVRPCHIWPQRPWTFSFPCSKCTSGSHLTPVLPNFHFRGRCGFQIIYHFPKCFHMCAAFPSVRGPCLRPTFSKCIKIQFGPKKFRHWCFIVVMSGNY